jgi:hypothetical protein
MTMAFLKRVFRGFSLVINNAHKPILWVLRIGVVIVVGLIVGPIREVISEVGRIRGVKKTSEYTTL